MNDNEPTIVITREDGSELRLSMSEAKQVYNAYTKECVRQIAMTEWYVSSCGGHKHCRLVQTLKRY